MELEELVGKIDAYKAKFKNNSGTVEEAQELVDELKDVTFRLQQSLQMTKNLLMMMVLEKTRVKAGAKPGQAKVLNADFTEIISLIPKFEIDAFVENLVKVHAITEANGQE